MVKLRESLLPVFDKVARGIPNKLGLRRFDVFIRKVTWDGERPGLGNPTVTDFPIVVNQNEPDNNRPKVVQLKSAEVVASGGRYQDGDYRVGPLTPQYVENGNTYGSLPNDILLDLQTNPTEIFVNLTNPDVEVEGNWFKVVNTNFSRNFGYTFVIRQTSEKPTTPP